MRFIRRTLPHMVIALNLAMMIVIYLDMRNPMMGFLAGGPFAVLAGACCVSSIVTAAVLYGRYRKEKARKQAFSHQKNSD